MNRSAVLWRKSIWGLATGLVLLSGAPAGAQDLDRDPLSYHILVREELRLKNYLLLTEGPGCNLGTVNAGGILRTTENTFEMPFATQIVTDDCGSAGGDVFQCFCNSGGRSFQQTCENWEVPVLEDE